MKYRRGKWEMILKVRKIKIVEVIEKIWRYEPRDYN
jgi:hypothetical protein